MKVLILADAASSHTLKWVRSLSEQGLEIQLMSLYASVEPGIQELVDAGRITLDLGEEGYNGAFLHRSFIRRVRAVRRTIRTWKPDVVHAYYASSYGLLGALSGFPKLAISVWGSDVFAFPDRHPLFRAILRHNLKRAERVFSTSEAMATRTRQFTKTPVQVIPFGVNLDAFAVPERSMQQPVVFGTVKTLAPVYGIDVLLRAYAHLRTQTETPTALRIVGKGPEEHALRVLAEELGIDSEVEFTGAVPHAEVARYLQNMDVFCALSREESFGVAIVEAQASGLPVVVSDAPGPAEIVTDGVNGFVVKREDHQAAAEAMLKLLDQVVWNKMGIAGLENARAHYHWPDQVQAQVNAYQELAAGSA